MKITILGAGVAASQLPGIQNRNMPAIVVQFDDNTLLFDCGEGTRFRLEEAGFQYAEIRHVAITHIHADHCVFTPFYQSVFVHNLWKGIPSGDMHVYGPSQVIDNLLPAIKIQVPELNHPQIPPYPTLHTNTMKSGDNISIGKGKLVAESVYHGFGLCDAIAFRLETPEGIFAYSGDSGECEGIRKICVGADVFICESSAGIGDEISPKAYGHLNPRLAGEIAKNGNVKTLILTHYAGFNSKEEMVADCRSSGFKGEILLAKDMQMIQR